MARGSIKHGTGGQLADHDAGYSANGESQFSRQSASTPDIKLNGYAPRQQHANKKKTTEQLIRFQKSALARMRYDLSMGQSTIKRQKLEKNIAIKTKFIATLERSQHEHQSQTPATGQTREGTKPDHVSKAWNWTEVETIPGEFEADYD
jgi:hypothetical protein